MDVVPRMRIRRLPSGPRDIQTPGNFAAMAWSSDAPGVRPISSPVTTTVSPGGTDGWGACSPAPVLFLLAQAQISEGRIRHRKALVFDFIEDSECTLDCAAYFAP